MTKKIIATVLVVAALGAAGYYAWRLTTDTAPRGAQETLKPATVSLAPVEAQTWREMRTAVASLTAVDSVQVTAEVSGIIARVAFESGERVRRGALLVQLDDEVDRATLKELEAELSLARSTLARQRKLAREEFVSEAGLDEARSSVRQIEARVARQKVLIAKKAVRAPFAGWLGLRRVSRGDFIDPGEPIVSLSTRDPVYADFTLPQQRIGELAAGQAVRLHVDGFTGKAFEGRITAISPVVTAATRNIEVRATLPNPEAHLKPGMFGTVEVILPAERKVLAIPGTAITYNPYGDSVFVIRAPGADAPEGADGVANRVFVKTGEHRGTLVEVTGGLEAGERVVSAGQLKLRDGQPVVIDNEVKPVADRTPTVSGH